MLHKVPEDHYEMECFLFRKQNFSCLSLGPTEQIKKQYKALRSMIGDKIIHSFPEMIKGKTISWSASKRSLCRFRVLRKLKKNKHTSKILYGDGSNNSYFVTFINNPFTCEWFQTEFLHQEGGLTLTGKICFFRMIIHSYPLSNDEELVTILRNGPRDNFDNLDNEIRNFLCFLHFTSSYQKSRTFDELDPRLELIINARKISTKNLLLKAW